MPPGGAAIDVHLLDVDGAADEDACARLLDAGEAARAARFLDPLARRRYVVRRGWLRRTLGRYVSRPPDALVFTRSAWGKPILAGGPRFSLSCSHGYAMAAVSADREVGCDLELRDPDFAREGLAERFFTAREAAQLTALPPGAALAGFFVCWTCKEAFVKALGLGLHFPLDAFEVDLHGPGAPSLGHGAEGWTVRAFEPVAGHQAAVVAPGAWRLGSIPAGL